MPCLSRSTVGAIVRSIVLEESTQKFHLQNGLSTFLLVLLGNSSALCARRQCETLEQGEDAVLLRVRIRHLGDPRARWCGPYGKRIDNLNRCMNLGETKGQPRAALKEFCGVQPWWGSESLSCVIEMSRSGTQQIRLQPMRYLQLSVSLSVRTTPIGKEFPPSQSKPLVNPAISPSPMASLHDGHLACGHVRQID